MSESPSSPPPEPETRGAATASRPPPSGNGWVILWLLAGLTSIASLGTSALFLGVFLKPHSFGARDAQGAAGLAALLLLAGAGVAVVSLPLTLWSGHTLRARGTPWAFHAAWGVPVGMGVLLFLYGLAAG